jgi:hypothetical protein
VYLVYFGQPRSVSAFSTERPGFQRPPVKRRVPNFGSSVPPAAATPPNMPDLPVVTHGSGREHPGGAAFHAADIRTLWEELKDAKEGNGTVIAAHNLDFQRPTRLTICARWIVESGVSEPG